jgi:hypothetical protein
MEGNALKDQDMNAMVVLKWRPRETGCEGMWCLRIRLRGWVCGAIVCSTASLLIMERFADNIE